MEVLTPEPLSELQKKQYLAELGLEQVLNNYNNEIIRHSKLCFKCRDKGLVCHRNQELRKKRNRVFKLMREEEKELC